MREFNHKLKNNENGFTIIELMISSLVFTVILLIATYAIIQISRTYIKGYVGTEVQNTNRGIEDQITQAIQASSGQIIYSTMPDMAGAYYFCIGNVTYTYQYNYILGATGNNDAVFIADPGAQCKPADLSSPPPGSTELLSKNMQLTGSGGIINQDPVNPDLYTVTINLFYGNSSSYTTPSAGIHDCDSISIGGAFCSSSSLVSTAEQRTASSSPIE